MLETHSYHQSLEAIRLLFPQPVSDPIHDSYFVHTVLRTLDRVDRMKSEIPILDGAKGPLDYKKALKSRLQEQSRELNPVLDDLVGYLSGSTLWGHPCVQQNVVPPATIASLIGALLAGLVNPNMSWDEYAQGLAVAEVETCAIAAELVGYDPEKAGGVFTFGGTGTTLYAVRAALTACIPDSMRKGVHQNVRLIGSDQGHYCRHTVASWLGLGADQVLTIPTRSDNSMDLRVLEREWRAALAEGVQVVAVIATMGTTDSFGIDDLESIVALRNELVQEFELDYLPHIHADAVIGWAWSAFRGYSYEQNPLGFRPRTLRAIAAAMRKLNALGLADSVGLDFHKTGFAPYISSAVLFKDKAKLHSLSRDVESMPYLYHFGQYKPGIYTLETSRSATGVMAALANFKLLGRRGFQLLLGHLIEMTQLLREYLEGHACSTVLNRDNVGPVTLFRVYPEDVDTFAIKEREENDPAAAELVRRHNSFNRQVSELLHERAMEGNGILLSMTECYRPTASGEPLLALKSYMMSPFIEEKHVKQVFDTVLCVRKELQRQSEPVPVG